MNKKPLFAFFGTSPLSVYVLNALETHGYVPALVVASPDKPRGRGLAVSPCAAKEWAQERGIEVITPDTLTRDLPPELANTDWDVFIVAAYPKLLPERILSLPRRGCLNVHPSLLPKFRGPSPVISAILADERHTGTSVMLMEAKMDAGPIVAQARIEIAEDEWPPKSAVLTEMLLTEGGNLLAEILPEWIRELVTPETQNESEATYTKKFTDADARLDMAGDARQNLRIIRAFDHGPRAYFLNERGKRVIVTEASIENGELKIIRVIPEGKREMLWEDYRRAV